MIKGMKLHIFTFKFSFSHNADISLQSNLQGMLRKDVQRVKVLKNIYIIILEPPLVGTLTGMSVEKP